MSAASAERPPSAWAETLAARHREGLVRHARVRLGPLEGWSEDLVASVLARMLAGAFDRKRVTEDQALPFAKGVLKNEALHLLRDEARLTALTTEPPATPGGRGRFERSWMLARRVERKRDVARALESLPAAQRWAVRLRYLRGWSVREIAEDGGVSEAAIRMRLTRARQRLRRLLRHLDSAWAGE